MTDEEKERFEQVQKVLTDGIDQMMGPGKVLAIQVFTLVDLGGGKTGNGLAIRSMSSEYGKMLKDAVVKIVTGSSEVVHEISVPAAPERKH